MAVDVELGEWLLLSQVAPFVKSLSFNQVKFTEHLCTFSSPAPSLVLTHFSSFPPDRSPGGSAAFIAGHLHLEGNGKCFASGPLTIVVWLKYDFFFFFLRIFLATVLTCDLHVTSGLLSPLATGGALSFLRTSPGHFFLATPSPASPFRTFTPDLSLPISPTYANEAA